MVQSNLLFLYLILPALILAYHLLREVWQKNIMLICASLLLYAAAQPAYVVVMLVLSYVNYRLGLRIDPEERKTIWLPVLINVGILAGFKYLTLVMDLLQVDTGGFRIMPIGLSVFIFSVLSYLLEVYHGTAEPEEDFGNLLVYFLMFPKLVQGPIVPYAQIRHQLRSRYSSPRAIFEGFQRFLFGLAKKVLLADSCGRLLTAVVGAGGNYTLVGVWYGAILFLFQIYYDFSGCCDMAIGLGRIFGFRYCENFNRPYLALSVTEFCGRWNMSLGRFFRSYVYEPLGGDSFGRPRQAINVMFCCLLVGLWHSTGLNYLVWAVFFAAVLIAEMYLHDSMRFWPDWLCRCWTLWFLTFGCILFSHENLSDLKNALAATLGYGGFSVTGLGRCIFGSLPLLIICILGCTNLPVYAKRIFAGICGMDRRSGNQNAISLLRVVYAVVSLLVVLLLLWLCTVAMTANIPLPPIYSRF